MHDWTVLFVCATFFKFKMPWALHANLQMLSSTWDRILQASTSGLLFTSGPQLVTASHTPFPSCTDRREDVKNILLLLGVHYWGADLRGEKRKICCCLGYGTWEKT